MVTKFQKGLLLILCISIFTSVLLPVKVTAEEEKKFLEDDYIKEPSYYYIEREYEEKGYKNTEDVEVVLKVEAISSPSLGSVPTERGIGGAPNDVLIWEEEEEWFEWNFSVPKDGLYEIWVDYYPLEDSSSPIQRSLYIDGNLPFFEAYNIVFPRLWADEGEPKVNNIGDEVRPRQIEQRRWVSVGLTDNSGMFSYPFRFYLTKGEHRLQLYYEEEPMAIDSITIKSPDRLLTYQEVKDQYKSNNFRAGGATEKFQAESNVVEKSSPTIRRENNGDPLTEPATVGYRKLNIIGDWSWRRGNDFITWKFSVPEDGLYKLGFRLGQWHKDGLPVYRQIEIDGNIPFEEMREYEIEYDKNLRTHTIADDEGEPYLFYLTEGEHEITMTAKVGPYRDVIFSIEDDALLLSKVIRQIIMVTGINPDFNFDYKLTQSIPDLIDNLEYLADSMDKKIDILNKVAKKRPAMVNNFLMIQSQLNGMIKRPDDIPRKLKDLENALTSLGTWMNSLQEHPLAIDYILIGAEEEQWEESQSNFFQQLAVSWQNFRRSFTKDYDSVGSIYSDLDDTEVEVINVWISRGKEWAELIKELADEEFTPNSNIGINMNVLPASQLDAGAVNALLLSICSGKAPDVACSVNPTSPVEFAIRDAVYDLSQFSDFENTIENFIPKIMIPFGYDSGVYALPETMGFTALFYRKDIMEELELELPDTWDDVYENILPILYRKGMQFYYGGGLTPFLFQYGGQYYTEDGKKSGLDSPEAFQAFREYTELYTNYGIPEAANFFNRFRQGEMPIGIGDYGLYITLSVAAPELAGRWGIAPVPGKKQSDGSIDRSVGGIAGEASVILDQSEKKEESWEFLKWWTSSDTQERFGKELEAYMGVQARWNTANLDAFKRLPWNKKDLEVIEHQWQWAEEMPVVLGGYFTQRHVGNAWNRVVLQDTMVRDSLEEAIKDINIELRRKQEEYGFTED